MWTIQPRVRINKAAPSERSSFLQLIKSSFRLFSLMDFRFCGNILCLNVILWKPPVPMCINMTERWMRHALVLQWPLIFHTEVERGKYSQLYEKSLDAQYQKKGWEPGKCSEHRWNGDGKEKKRTPNNLCFAYLSSWKVFGYGKEKKSLKDQTS